MSWPHRRTHAVVVPLKREQLLGPNGLLVQAVGMRAQHKLVPCRMCDQDLHKVLWVTPKSHLRKSV
jgi:hypothetical protein